MKRKLLLSALCSLCPFLLAITCLAEDTPHYNVVYEYIQSLGAVHLIQETATKELQDDDTPIGKLMTGIRSGTRMKLELGTSITALEGMTLKKPFDTLLPNTISFYKHKIELHDTLIAISQKFMKGAIDGPEPGVDYSQLTATMPKITASLEEGTKGTLLFCQRGKHPRVPIMTKKEGDVVILSTRETS
jgi:hypothetical protein